MRTRSASKRSSVCGRVFLELILIVFNFYCSNYSLLSMITQQNAKGIPSIDYMTSFAHYFEVDY
jgi:hypothetical protein